MARGRKRKTGAKSFGEFKDSQTKKSWDRVRGGSDSNKPMGPGQSMAMAGNTGLAGFSENQANEIKKAQEIVNRFRGDDSSPVTFQSIGQQVGEMGSKYRRPIDFDKFADKARLFNQGIAAGGKISLGPDGIPRLQLANKNIKNALGETILSMQLPQMTASAPTFGQLGGDISRAFTGYNSLKYPDANFQGPFPLGQNANMPYMSRTPGMFESIDPLSLIPGLGTAMKVGEGIQSVYDFMFPKPPVVNYGGSSDITVTEQPMFPYNFETIMKPKPDPLLPSEMSQEQFMESYPELYSGDPSFKNISSFNPDTYQPGYLPEGYSNVGVENPLFRNVSYEPIRVSDMDMTGVTAQEGDRPVLPENVIPKMRVGEPINIDQYKTPVLPPEVTDPRMYQGQTLYAQNFGLPSLKQSYDFLRNPEVSTPLGSLRFDDVLSGNPKLGYENTIMINGVPVDVSATIGNQGLNVGGSFSFKKGGSVDKYAGLGYKLK